MIHVILVFASILVLVSGELIVKVTLPSGRNAGRKVSVPARPDMLVSQFRDELAKVLDDYDRPYALVLPLCSPLGFFPSISPTPSLPLDPNKTLEAQGVSSMIFDEIELPLFWFPFRNYVTKQNIVFPGCSWSTPEEVLSASKSRYREFRAEMPPEPTGAEPGKAGKSVFAYDSPEKAKNATERINVISDEFCTFQVAYSPKEHPFRSIFKCNSDSTVKDLRKAIFESVNEKTKDIRLAHSIPLCHPEQKKENYMMRDTQKLADIYGSKILDFNLYRPVQFVKTILDETERNVGVCLEMTCADFEDQVRMVYGLKADAPVVLSKAELTSGTAIPGKKRRLSSFFFSALKNTPYRIRLNGIPKKYLLPEGQLTGTVSALSAGRDFFDKILNQGRKLFGDRRVVIAGLVVIFGLVLIVLGVSSSTSTSESDEKAGEAEGEESQKAKSLYAIEPIKLKEINEPLVKQSPRIVIHEEEEHLSESPIEESEAELPDEPFEEEMEEEIVEEHPLPTPPMVDDHDELSGERPSQHTPESLGEAEEESLDTVEQSATNDEPHNMDESLPSPPDSAPEVEDAGELSGDGAEGPSD